jgi:hypothetical protein
MHWNLFYWSNLGDENWVFGVINFGIQLIPNINWFWVKKNFPHGSIRCILQLVKLATIVIVLLVIAWIYNTASPNPAIPNPTSPNPPKPCYPKPWTLRKYYSLKKGDGNGPFVRSGLYRVNMTVCFFEAFWLAGGGCSFRL